MDLRDIIVLVVIVIKWIINVLNFIHHILLVVEYNHKQYNKPFTTICLFLVLNVLKIWLELKIFI